jgi:hypothetical protein
MADYLQDDRGIGVLWMIGNETIAGPWLPRLVETKRAELMREGPRTEQP